MIVVRDGETSKLSTRDSVIAIGVFDGLHLGHQAVIDMLLHLDGERARDAVPTIVTFDPHPALVLAPERAIRLLGTLDQRLEGFDALGIEQVRVVNFDRELADESAPDFIGRVLAGELHAWEIVVGEDFRFGHDRVGDVALLSAEGQRYGFGVYEAPTFGAPRWSSTAVREALVAGDLDDGAFGGEVALHDDEAAGGFERVRPRADDDLAGGFDSDGGFFGEGLAGDGGRVP